MNTVKSDSPSSLAGADPIVKFVDAAVNPRERDLSCLGSNEKSHDKPQRV